jgi:succinate dehydrogenase / fumarate reductase flavoprotein subunit
MSPGSELLRPWCKSAGCQRLDAGLADGYFVLPNTINDYLADGPYPTIDRSHPAVIEAVNAVRARISKLLSVNGSRTVDSFHRSSAA